LGTTVLAGTLLWVLLGGAVAAAHEIDPRSKVVHRDGKTFREETHGDPLDMADGDAGAAPFRAAGPDRDLAAVSPSPWCGTERSTDFTATSLGANPAIKVVYAHPSDRNNFGSYKNFIQDDIKGAIDRVASVSGATKTLRVDLGTDCATNPLNYVDIQSIPLASTAATYMALAPTTRFNQIKSEVAAALGVQGGLRNIAVYADGVGSPGGDGVAGIGTSPQDDSADPSNATNDGDRYAEVFGSATGTGDFYSGFQAYAGEFVLHEISHTLGAVQDSAPHTTGAGHCTDEPDVMCYDDGGPTSTITTPCNPPFTPSHEAYDCNLDDYFRPNPLAGSYLATHWNIQNSQFLCPLARCQTAGNPPNAVLGGQSHGHVGVPFTLNAGGSTDDTGIAAYHWDLDADSVFEVATGATPTVTRTFDNAGFPANSAVTYPFKVNVTDTDGAIDNATRNFTVFPPLQISATVSNVAPAVGEQVTFDGSGSADPDGEPVSFAWDFDGNGSVDSTAAQAATSYPAAGSFNATLTIADSVGASAVAGTTVNVAGGGGSQLARVATLAISPGSFRAEASGPSAKNAARKGTTVRFSLNSAAAVGFTVERKAKGRKVGRKCRKPSRRNRGKRRCTRFQKVRGSFSRNGKAGSNRFHFSGRMAGRKLKRARYRLVALPKGTPKGLATRTPFRIVR
jgi:hypothetical protein